METMNWKIDGMHCSNCALTISRYLEQEGLQNVKVSLVSGEVGFEWNGNAELKKIEKGIGDLGYSIVSEPATDHQSVRRPLNRQLLYLLICLPFTLLLILHMFPPAMLFDWLMNPWIQLGLCLPVYITGMRFFGRSAIKSIRNGLPNMNVLIALGATAAFAYSLVGTVLHLGEAYLFYETAAGIISLVFFGNYLEDIAVRSTQQALNSLSQSKQVMANMIAFDEEHKEVIFPVKNTVLCSGDLILIKSGEPVPTDCKVLWGEANVNEAIISGENLPVIKRAKDKLIGGSVLLDGLVKAQVIAATTDSTLNGIINLVKRAQGEKPPVQVLADRISAVFVPTVLLIALVVFIVNDLLLHSFSEALMRSIAVLVIACPCAMGLATPAAIAVGLGRAAKNGILFRHAKSLELFSHIRQVAFDKTGTLTTGEFKISAFQIADEKMGTEEFKQIAWSLEKYSNHPIASCIARSWKTKLETRWSKLEEVRGMGMKGLSTSGDLFWAGSHKIALSAEVGHDVYITKNGELSGWIDLIDEIRPEADKVMTYFRSRKIKTILLSGDRLSKCLEIGTHLGMDQIFAEQSPEQKLERIGEWNEATPTAMVGDGINDAPALAKATIGISMSDSAHITMQTSDLVLMNKGLKNLPAALRLGRLTYLTIRQNLFWAFFYNMVAIPVAAVGLLTPTVGALVMGLSDVLLLANSIRLYAKKIN
jgi:P-type Cu+ transporter